MMNKRVVREFRNRTLDDFTWLKKASLDQLQQEVFDIAGDDCFTTDPYKHQYVCYLLGTIFPEFLYLLDMGLGKSKISCDLINYRKTEGELKRALIVPPTVANVDDWLTEVETHTPELNAVGLIGNTEEKLDILYSNIDADVFVISYPALRFLLTEFVRRKKKDGNQLKPSPKVIRAFVKLFNFLVLDESHFCRNHRSLTYRLCNQVSLKCEFRIGLTGTPFGRDPTALWSQFKLIDRGDALGKTLGLFREAFFKTKSNHFSGFDEYVFDSKNEDLLYQTLKHRSIYYEDKECGDIPKENRIKVSVPFPAVNYEYYKTMLEQLRGATDKKQKEVAFIRMRQISSGFVGIIGKDSHKVEMAFPYNPKLERLRELVESLPLNRKMIIFYEFVKSSAMIVQMLKELKINYAFYTKGKVEEKVKFQKDPKVRILVITNRAVGLNLQVANYITYYECPVSPIDRNQSERRATGARQKKYKRVFIYDLVTDNSVDQDILDFISEGKDLFDSIVKGKHRV